MLLITMFLNPTLPRPHPIHAQSLTPVGVAAVASWVRNTLAPYTTLSRRQ